VVLGTVLKSVMYGDRASAITVKALAIRPARLGRKSGDAERKFPEKDELFPDVV